LYLNLVPALTSGQARILDLPRLRSQFLSLERRVTRGTGKEIVDHPSSGADDLANAVAGCLVLAATAERHKVTWTFWSVGGDVALEQDEEDEQRRRLYVRTENLDSAGRPIMPTTDVPIVRPQGPRRIGGNDHWVH
jgi:hypothetical protein